MQDELQKVLDSKVRSDSSEYMKSDFWKHYEEVLREKLGDKVTDTLNLEDVRLYRAQGATQVLIWVIQTAPEEAIKRMRPPSQQ